MSPTTASVQCRPMTLAARPELAARLEPDRLEGGILLRQQHTVRSEQAAARLQGAFRRSPRQLRVVILFGEVRKDHSGSTSIIVARKEFRESGIREVTYAAEHALLDRPRIPAVAQHLQIVIALDH